MFRSKRWLTRLHAHDWFSALVELVIVVVGILIALEVNNWNNNRQDRKRADQYLHNIHSELLTDIANIDAAGKFWGKVLTHGERAIAFGESGALVDGSAWKTVLAWYHASQIMQFRAADTSFEEMRSAGNLRLIENTQLRKDIAHYYHVVGGSTPVRLLLHDPLYRQHIRGITPWPIQQYILKECFLPAGYFDQDFLDCPSPVADSEATALLLQYRASPQLLNDLRSWMSTLHLSKHVLSNSHRKTAENLLGRTGGPPRNATAP